MADASNQLTPDQVQDVLLAIGREPVGRTAERVGRSRQAISSIQRGSAYADVHPELPRRQRRRNRGRVSRPARPVCTGSKSRNPASRRATWACLTFLRLGWGLQQSATSTKCGDE